MKECSKITTKVVAERKRIFELEEFIYSIPFLTSLEKGKLVIIASEILDNIIVHTPHKLEEESKLSVLIVVRKGLVSTSISFAFYSEGLELVIDKISKKSVYYDDVERRYRGLGLIMCYNLSSSIHYRLTKKYNVIRVKL